MYLYLEILLIFVILIALLFTLTNGLHDASSIVATFITCGAATPVQAVLLASSFGLLGALTSGSAVANTIAKVVNIPAEPSLLPILFSALLGAVTWNVITWQKGLPSSSTHALIGGIIGAVWIAKGQQSILWGWHELLVNHHLTGIIKVIIALVISPIIGFIAAFFIQKISELLLRNAKYTINKWIKKIQWILAALLAYSQSANDTQKIAGLITLALFSAHQITVQTVPVWVKIMTGLVMFMGTVFGGWTIMKTLGRGIFTIRPIHSLNSQLTSGVAIILATMFGAPVSTTHVVVGSVMGVGAADEHKMVNWKVGKEIVIAWFITIPCAAFVAAFIYFSLNWLITNR